MPKLVKILLPCGDMMFFDEDSWDLGEEDGDEAYFVEPTPRCEFCSFPQREMYEGKYTCPAKVSRVDMTDAEMAEQLVKIPLEG